MQNQQQPWGGSPYNYNPQGAMPLDNKQNTPPLQHPIPQHPITNFNPSVHQQPAAASPGFAQPQPQQQAYGYAPPTPGQGGQYNNNMYNNFGFNDPTTQLGMQFAGNAVAQGTAYMERNV